MAGKRKHKHSTAYTCRHAKVERARQNAINGALNDFIGVIPGFTKKLKKKDKLQLITIYLKYAFWHVWKMNGLPILNHFSAYEIWLFTDEHNGVMDSSHTSRKSRIMTAENLLMGVDQSEKSCLDVTLTSESVKIATAKNFLTDADQSTQPCLNHISVPKQVKKRKCQDNEKHANVLCPIKKTKRPCIIYLKNADKSSNISTVVSLQTPPLLLSSEVISDDIGNSNDASARVNSFETNSITSAYGQNDLSHGIFGTEPHSLHQCPSDNITLKQDCFSQEITNSTFAPISQTPVSCSNFVACDYTNPFSYNLTFNNIADDDHWQGQECSFDSDDDHRHGQECSFEAISGLDLLAHVSSRSDCVFDSKAEAELSIYENTQDNMSTPKCQFSEPEQGPFPYDYNFDERNVISVNSFSENVQNCCFENIGILNGIENRPVNDTFISNDNLTFNVTFPKDNENTNILNKIENIADLDDLERDCTDSDFDFKAKVSDVIQVPKHPYSNFQKVPILFDHNYSKRNADTFSGSAQNSCFQNMDIPNGIENLVSQNKSTVNSETVDFNVNLFRNANNNNTNILRNIEIENTTHNPEGDSTVSDFFFDAKFSDVIKSNKTNCPPFYDENTINNIAWLERGKEVVIKKNIKIEKSSEGNEIVQNQNIATPFVSRKVIANGKVDNMEQKWLNNSSHQQILVDSQNFAKLKPHYTNNPNDNLSAKADTKSCKFTALSPAQSKTEEYLSSSEFKYDKENLGLPLPNQGRRKTRNSNKNTSVFEKPLLKDRINIIKPRHLKTI